MNSRINIASLAALLLGASHVLCLEAAVRHPGLTDRSLYLAINNEKQVSHLSRLIQKNSNEIDIFTQELNELTLRMQHFRKSEHVGATLEEVGIAGTNLSQEIEFHTNMIAKLNQKNDEYRAMISNLREQQASIAPHPPAAERVLPQTFPVTETITTTTINTTLLPTGETQQTTVTEEVERVVGGDIDKTDASVKSKVVEDVPTKKGWRTFTKIIIGILVAAAVVAMMVVGLYLQKS